MKAMMKVNWTWMWSFSLQCKSNVLIYTVNLINAENGLGNQTTYLQCKFDNRKSTSCRN